MHTEATADAIDRRILDALNREPDATNVAIAEVTGLARNTVRARRSRYERERLLNSFDRRIDPTFLGFPLQAFLLTTVTQRKLASVAAHLSQVPEVVQVHGLSGAADLLVYVVARDADDLYRIAGRVLAIDGVRRTTTSLVMGEFVEFRLAHLVSSR